MPGGYRPARFGNWSRHIEQPQLGFLGSPYINVLQLNEALASLR